MSSSYDVYFRRNTWIYRLDPRVKLALVLVLIVLTFLWPSVSMALGVSAAALMLLLVAQVPRSRIVRFLRGMVVLLGLSSGAYDPLRRGHRSSLVCLGAVSYYAARGFTRARC